VNNPYPSIELKKAMEVSVSVVAGGPLGEVVEVVVE
jgi:hypothetical protein